MKVGILLGRGIEGCGVTKMAIEQAKWYNKNGHEAVIIANRDKTWPRKKTHDFAEIEVYHEKFKDPKNTETIKKMVENLDLLYVDSVPSIKHPAEGIDLFRELVTQKDTPIVFIQLDHNVMSIRRNACMIEAVENAKAIFAFGVKNDFVVFLEKKYAKEGKTFDREILTYAVPFPFDEARKTYWKDINEQDPKHHKWIGRCTSWKGQDVMFKFHDQFLQGGECLTTLEGIERGPAFLSFRELYDYEDHTKNKEGIKSVDLTKYYGEKANVFSIFRQPEMLERMSKVGFGYQLSILKPRYITTQVEYTHCEVVAAGAIPVFRKGWGDLAKHRVTGIPLSECKDTGTIWLDETNFEESYETIKKLESDPVMRNEWREKAFKFYKNHQDSDHIVKEMHSQITSRII